ncbi:DUF4156 domain-containing protein [Endozoicomonas elysicola]|uniref:Membrane protein n=1 Tax=Endozoicomonas elysicola TaxID=305900 RepID=A0A081KH21_9GAMM|nr:DUF4156 domain-containing protein [Endozoicomonas elysicola]KEI73447.1 membrane protein [Endozoicomonas elysicola]
MIVKKCLLGLMVSLSLTGCITFPTEESGKVQVVWDETDRIEGCELKGTVYGSEGHFYDYWLHSDRDMVWGTINQMSIKAVDMGADTLYLYRPFGFLSSVTMMANAYDCRVKIASNNGLHIN